MFSAISIGAIIGLSPWIKYEVDDPVGIKQFKTFQDKQTYNYITVDWEQEIEKS